MNRALTYLIAAWIAFIPALAVADGLALPGIPQTGQIGAAVSYPPSSGGATYTGPLDVNSTGVKAWYGVMAATSATRGNKLLNACNSTGGVDVGCGDMFSDPTTGILDSATIGGITCPGTNCTVKTLYDLSGALACTGGVACDATQATIANRASLIANCINSTIPCLQSAANSVFYESSATLPTFAQPYTVSLVASRTGNFTTPSIVLSDAGNNTRWLWDGTANTFAVSAGATLDNSNAACNDSTVRAFQGIANGASSVVVCGTNAATGAGGATTWGAGSANQIEVMGLNGGFGMIGNFAEVGLFAAAWNSTQYGSQHSNQATRYGVP